MQKRIALAFAVTLLVGCGSSDSGTPADFAGQYTGTSTNGASTCPGDWNMGQMAQGQFNLVQTGADVRFDAQGATGLVMFAIYGTATFTGQVAGNHIDAAIVGSINNTQGACVFTWRGALTGDLAGDKMEGILTSTPNTNGHADCDTLKVTGCSRSTTFSYTRAAK